MKPSRSADYIACQFRQLGLKTELFNGTAMQKFSLTTSTELGPDNKLTLIGRKHSSNPSRPFVVTAFMRSFPGFSRTAPMNRGTTNGFGESKIGDLKEIDSALRKHKGGDRVSVVVRRGEELLTFEVTLDPPR